MVHFNTGFKQTETVKMNSELSIVESVWEVVYLMTN